MNQTLREAYQGVFDIGAAVNARTIRSAGELIGAQYNSITAENEMKPERVHPEEDRYTFEEADEIVAFARANGLRMRGHTLVWHNQTPDWFFEDGRGGKATKEAALARLRSHIRTVVKRYAGDVYCWDVVNEAVDDAGPGTLRATKWLDVVGPSYIAKAFEFAHEADPKALLFYNDYNESHPAKRERIYALVQSLVDSGAPIHGVGLQAHWNVYDPPLDDIRRAIERYASLGLRLHITEMDVSMFAFDDRRTDLAAPTEDMLALQEERYESFFRVFLEFREAIDSVTFWGAADDYTWLHDFPVRGRTNWPLLFDARHQPKRAFNRVAALAEAARSEVKRGEERAEEPAGEPAAPGSGEATA